MLSCPAPLLGLLSRHCTTPLPSPLPLSPLQTRSGPAFDVEEALRLVKTFSKAGFNETVDVQMQLGVDPRKPNQNIRGIAQLPYGTGKAVSIAVFARGEKAEEARKAGASLVGAEDLVEKISKGEVPLNFNKTIATPDVMPLIGKIARVLGPRGLMPNPKLGTVTMAVKEAVQAAKKGQAEFRAEKRGIVSAGIGKVSFSLQELKENLRAFALAVGDQKPEGLKGSYIRTATLSSTMGPGIPVDIAFVDPTSPRFMEELTAEARVAAAAASGLPAPPAAGAVVAAAAAAAAASAAPAATAKMA